MKNFRRHGFSLIELIIVIAVIAVIAGIMIPSISGTQDAAKAQKAIAAAEALNMAQVQYRLQAGASWGAAATDAARYVLLAPYMTYAAATLAAYEANIDSGMTYTFTFQAFTANGQAQKVILLQSGTAVTY